MDPSKTYVFLYIQPGDVGPTIKRRRALVQILKRNNGRWQYTTRYLGEGDAVGTEKFPTSLKVLHLEAIKDDILVTFADFDGKEIARSGKADLDDPIRRFLSQMS